MKRVFLMVCSICLVIASLFGLFTGVAGLRDAKNLQDYKTEDSDLGLEAVDTLLDGIEQLRENEDAYTKGVSTYEAGLIEYSEGKSTLNAGYKEYYAGKKKLEEGKKTLAEGKKALAEGKKAYEAGKKQIEENTQAYNEGKATLAKIEPIMPYVDQYVEFRDGAISKLPGNSGKYFTNAQKWFVNVVRPIAAKAGLDIPADVTDLPAYIQQMVADGKAQLKQYEDGVAQLEKAEKTIAAGEAEIAAGEREVAAGEKALKDAEKQLAQGEKDLAAGGRSLAEGKAKLSEFEDGASKIAAGLELLLGEEENSTGTYYFDENTSDEIACPSILSILKERYGEDWTYWKTDDDGKIVVKNGCQYLDLDTCEQAAIAAQDYINAYQGDPNINGETFERIFYCLAHPDGEITYENLGHDVTLPCSQCETVISEVVARYLVSVLEIIVSIMALISGIFGIVYSASRCGMSGMVCGWVTFGLGLAATVFGFCTDFTGYIYPLALYSGGERSGYEFSSHLQAPALIVLTVIAFAFAMLALFSKKEEKKTAYTEAVGENDSILPEHETDFNVLSSGVAETSPDEVTVKAE